jgi:hypothetical protein
MLSSTWVLFFVWVQVADAFQSTFRPSPSFFVTDHPSLSRQSRCWTACHFAGQLKHPLHCNPETVPFPSTTLWSTYSGKYGDEKRRASTVRRRLQRPGKEDISTTSTSTWRQPNSTDTERNSVKEKVRRQQEPEQETTMVEVEFLTPGGGVVTKQAAMARAKALPLDKLLEALDRRNIMYHPKATRVQLEVKLADEIIRTHSRLLAATTAASRQGEQEIIGDAKADGAAAGNASTTENGTRQQPTQTQQTTQQPNFEFYSRDNNASLGEGTTIDVEVTTVGGSGNNTNRRTGDRMKRDPEERRRQKASTSNSNGAYAQASSSAWSSEKRAQGRRQQRQSTEGQQPRRGRPSGTRYEYDRAGTPFSPIDPALFKEVVSTGGRAAKSLLNTAKYTANKALDTFDQWWDGDDGAEEPEWMYVRKDPTATATTTPRRPSRSSRPRKPRSQQEANPRPYSSSFRSRRPTYDNARGRYYATQDYEDEEERQRILRRRQREARQRPPQPQAAPSCTTTPTNGMTTLALSPSNIVDESSAKATGVSAQRTRRGRRRNNGVDDDGDGDVDGNNDDERAPQRRTRRRNTAAGVNQNENAAKSSRPQPASAPSRASGDHAPSSNYWRDRLTERVDNLLGLNHDEEKIYNEWAQKKEREEQQHRRRRDEGDPFSVLIGDEINHPRRSNRNKQKKRTGIANTKDSKQPFWQQQGSLSALLFGRPGHKLSSISTFKVSE